MSKFLEDFANKAKADGHNIYRVSEIYKGGEAETLELQHCNPCQNCYSVAKVFTMTAIGMLWDRGFISLDEKVVDIFADSLPEGMDERWSKATVDMVLRHRIGMPGGYLDIDRLDIRENFGEDFLRFVLSTKPQIEPGTEYCYSDAAYYLLSRIFTAKSGEMMDEFLWRELFWPLGFQEAAWSKCPKGYPMGATGLYVRSSDVAKLGQLYLDRGVYKGQRILSEAWIDKALEREYELSPTGHGDSYWKGGMMGQQLLIVPCHNRVVSWHAYESGGFSEELVFWSADYEG